MNRSTRSGIAAPASPRGEAPGVEVHTLRVAGMDCSSCAESVEKALHQLDGVEDVRVDVVGGRVTVEYREGTLARGELAGSIDRVGYRVESEVLGSGAGPVAPARGPGSWWERRGRLALAIVSGALLVVSFVAAHVLELEAVAAACAIGAVVAGGWTIVPRGIRAAMNRALDMNFLMSIAALGALLIGEYAEAGSAMFLFAVAQLLESHSMDRARNAIRALMELSPAEATVMRAGREVRIPADQVRIGETVVVRPGEKIAVDGVVVGGLSSVDQAPITGEAMPVEKALGAEVFAGTLNGEGALEVRSTKPASDTTLARIIHSVEKAQASRAPSQSFVDRFARVYTPVVVAAAIALAVFPPITGFGAWGEWFYRGLVLLVVACPCALVISTPVTIVSALTGAAREGILIKGGLHLENAGRARVLAIDKTGTLTKGEPVVVEVASLDGTDPRELLSIAAAAEARSDHPLARAILRRANEDGVAPTIGADARAVTGRGVTARAGGRVVYVGNERLLRQLGAPVEDALRVLRAYEEQGRTAVLVGSTPVDAEPGARPALIGVIALADGVRPQAARALRDLRSAGIERIAMLTGDNAATARAVAAALGGPGVGVDAIRAELLPEDKVAAVRELRRSDGKMLMVGDGVNDAPALAAADVGIAMGTAGTDVALETADIALIADDLTKLPTTIRLARRAERIIRANIALSLVTKAAFVVLAVLGVATLWMAVLADMGTSLLVIANGLRALRG